jgi:hypothetical protein
MDIDLNFIKNNMTPKEKAKELMLKFKEAPIKGTLAWYVSFELSKRFALIATDEVLNELFEMAMVTGSSYVHKHIDYYQEVKQEIENL